MMQRKRILGVVAAVAGVMALAPACGDESVIDVRNSPAGDASEGGNDDGGSVPPRLDSIQINGVGCVDDLDFSGNFVYAVDLGRSGSSPGTIGNAAFTPGTTAGVFVSSSQGSLNFGSPDFSCSEENESEAVSSENRVVSAISSSSGNSTLEAIMSNIVWSIPPNPVVVTLDDLEVGDDYKLQLLFFEACCPRAFDVFVEGELVADDLAPWRFGSTSAGPVAVIVEFTATDGTLEIELSGANVADSDSTDHNPILDGLTLELLP